MTENLRTGPHQSENHDYYLRLHDGLYSFLDEEFETEREGSPDQKDAITGDA